MTRIQLPRADRSIETFTLSAPRFDFSAAIRPLNRIALAAAHVVADPLRRD